LCVAKVNIGASSIFIAATFNVFRALTVATGTGRGAAISRHAVLGLANLQYGVGLILVVALGAACVTAHNDISGRLAVKVCSLRPSRVNPHGKTNQQNCEPEKTS
jgi:hypothetical protein